MVNCKLSNEICMVHGTKKKYESQTGIKPITSCKLGGPSIHWAMRTRGELGHLTEFKFLFILLCFLLKWSIGSYPLILTHLFQIPCYFILKATFLGFYLQSLYSFMILNSCSFKLHVFIVSPDSLKYRGSIVYLEFQGFSQMTS